MKSIRNLFFLIVGTCLIFACGQKGSLYLPQDEPEPVTTTAAGTDENQAEPDDGEENGKS